MSELYEVLNCFCHRNSGAVSSEDKKRHSFMLKRLFSAQYPIQCNLVNNLDSEPEMSANLVALLATRYSDIPDFLKMKVNQKKRTKKAQKNQRKKKSNKKKKKILK